MNHNSAPDEPSVARSAAAAEFEPPRASIYILGMAILLVSLGVLFAATMAGYLVVRLRAQDWRPANMPPLPWGLWLSTLILIGCSVSIHRALRMAQHGMQKALRRALSLALILGVAFLVMQTVNWAGLVAQQMTIRSGLYGFTFYTLTGIHAAHVIGGVAQLMVVTRRAFSGLYSPDLHIGVTLSAMYWHFLDGVWLVMFLCLMAIS